MVLPFPVKYIVNEPVPFLKKKLPSMSKLPPIVCVRLLAVLLRLTLDPPPVLLTAKLPSTVNDEPSLKEYPAVVLLGLPVFEIKKFPYMCDKPVILKLPTGKVALHVKLPKACPSLLGSVVNVPAGPDTMHVEVVAHVAVGIVPPSSA